MNIRSTFSRIVEIVIKRTTNSADTKSLQTCPVQSPPITESTAKESGHTAADTVDIACATCGSANTKKVDYKFSVPCSCGSTVPIYTSNVDPWRGAVFMHGQCTYKTWVPPTVWCPQCHANFVPHWRDLCVTGNSEEIDAAVEKHWATEPTYRVPISLEEYIDFTFPNQNPRSFEVETDQGLVSICFSKFFHHTYNNMLGGSNHYFTVAAETIPDAKEIRAKYFPPAHLIPSFCYFEARTPKNEVVARDKNGDYEV